MFVRNASDEQLAALLATTGQPPQGAEELSEERFAAGRAFYGALLAGTGNAILQRMFASIEARIQFLRRVSLRTPGRLEQSRREFIEMLRWIEERDAARAAEAAKMHVLGAKAAALRVLRERNAAGIG
jgi:DNA-binding GntR family transcriptional regulator